MCAAVLAVIQDILIKYAALPEVCLSQYFFVKYFMFMQGNSHNSLLMICCFFYIMSTTTSLVTSWNNIY